ncbi:MAG: phosphopantetheine-binding protein [Pseudobdellovibrio sp.]
MEKEQERTALTNQVIEIIFQSLNLKHLDKSTVSEITPITATGLNLDSVDILEIIVQLEHTFGIKMSESESYATHFVNIGTVVDFIKSKK